MKVILNHSSTRGGPLAFESLANYRLPSRPTESLASILFQRLAVIGDPQDPMRLPTEFCEQVIELWRSCHKEGVVGVRFILSGQQEEHRSSLVPWGSQSRLG